MSKPKWTNIKDVIQGSKTGKKINIRGWIYRTRSSGNIVFMVIRDNGGILQATIKKGNLSEEDFNDAKKALIESSLELEGIVREDKRAPGGYELQVSDLKIINFAEKFPIVKDQSPEFLLDKRHLWIRSQYLTSILKVRSTVVALL